MVLYREPIPPLTGDEIYVRDINAAPLASFTYLTDGLWVGAASHYLQQHPEDSLYLPTPIRLSWKSLLWHLANIARHTHSHPATAGRWGWEATLREHLSVKELSNVLGEPESLIRNELWDQMWFPIDPPANPAGKRQRLTAA